MKKQVTLTLLAAATQFTQAQDLNIDDFSTGPSGLLQYRSGPSNRSTQSGPNIPTGANDFPRQVS